MTRSLKWQIFQTNLLADDSDKMNNFFYTTRGGYGSCERSNIIRKSGKLSTKSEKSELSVSIDTEFAPAS